MKLYIAIILLSCAPIWSSENKPTVQEHKKQATKGAIIEAIFFLHNQKNYFTDYIYQHGFIDKSKDNEHIAIALRSLNKYIEELSANINQLKQESTIAKQSLNRMIRKARLIRSVCTLQDRIINLLYEMNVKTNVAKKYMPKVKRRKDKYYKLHSILIQDTFTGVPLDKALKQIIDQLENFVQFCHDFKKNNIAKLNQLKNKRNATYQHLLEEFGSFGQQLFLWWPDYIKKYE